MINVYNKICIYSKCVKQDNFGDVIEKNIILQIPYESWYGK